MLAGLVHDIGTKQHINLRFVRRSSGETTFFTDKVIENFKGEIGNMSLILININDIAVGHPLPWALYDKEHNLLGEPGSEVRDDEHLSDLLALGAYRELLLEVSDDESRDRPFAVQTISERTRARETSIRFTFNDMKLRVEDRLQLQPPKQLSNERFQVKVIGYVRGVSLLVTAPTDAKGFRLQVMDGETVVMRSFIGQNAFGFECTIIRIHKTPCEYLHLSFPDAIEGIVIRKAPRIRTRIIATVQNKNQGNASEPVSALISNISANGVALDTKRPLGSKGDVINLTFRVNLHNVDALLSVKGLIRAVLTNCDAETSNPNPSHYGIEFIDLHPNDSVILQSMVYQNMIESPHQLM
jgi:c-di-GMP-binding flagellar brake protein YcgR